MNNFDFDFTSLVEEVSESAKVQNYKHSIRKYCLHEERTRDWCSDKEKGYVERYLLPVGFDTMNDKERDTAIIELIKQVFPERIDNTIYHFPFQWFYFITDKGYYFTLNNKPRLATKDEREELKIARNNALKYLEDKEILMIHKFVKALKDIEKHTGSTMSKEEFDSRLFTECKRKWFNGSGKNPIAHYEKLKELYTQFTDAVQDFIALAVSIDEQCNKSKEWFVYPHDLKSQVSIYLSKKQSYSLEKLGYKIHEYSQPQIVKEWSETYLNYEFSKQNTIHYCIKINKMVFISACKNNKLLPMGHYIDEQGNEVELKRGRTKGCTNDHLTKSITLFNPETIEILSFNSMQELADKFDMPKSNVSRTLKGKTNGDVVKFKKVKFILGLPKT